MRCAPRASNGPSHLGLCALQYRLSNFHDEPLAVKTDAPTSFIWDIMRCWVQRHPITAKAAETPGARILATAPTAKIDFTYVKGSEPDSESAGGDAIPSLRFLLARPQRCGGPCIEECCTAPGSSKFTATASALNAAHTSSVNASRASSASSASSVSSSVAPADLARRRSSDRFRRLNRPRNRSVGRGLSCPLAVATAEAGRFYPNPEPNWGPKAIPKAKKAAAAVPAGGGGAAGKRAAEGGADTSGTRRKRHAKEGWEAGAD